MMRPPASGPSTADSAQTLASQPWIFARSIGGIEVADDGHRGRLDGAGADALDKPEGDQRRHRPGEPAQDRAEQEDHDPDQHDRLAAAARSASLPNTTVVAVWVRRNAENTQL